MAENGKKSDLVFEILRKAGEINQVLVDVLWRYVEEWGVTPYQAVLETEVLSQSRLADLLAENLSLSRVFKVHFVSAHPEDLLRLPYKKSKEIGCLCLGLHEDGKRMTFAFADPTQKGNIREVEEIVGYPLDILIGEYGEIHSTLDSLYPTKEQFFGS